MNSEKTQEKNQENFTDHQIPTQSINAEWGGKNIFKALCKAQSEFPEIKKTASNPYFKSKYADLSEIISAVRPALNANGLLLTQRLSAVDSTSYVETRICHAESGEMIWDRVMVLTAKQNDPQAYGSGITYARRYSIQCLIGIVADDDDDGEAAMARKEPAKKAEAQAQSSGNAFTEEQWLWISQHKQDITDYMKSKGTTLEKMSDRISKNFSAFTKAIEEYTKEKAIEAYANGQQQAA